MRLPSTPEEVEAFIGVNFNTLQYGATAEDNCYSLTVHDLLSAFRDLEAFPLAAASLDPLHRMQAIDDQIGDAP